MRRRVRRPPVWQSRVADGIVWFAVISILLACAGWLGDELNRL